MQWIVRNGLYRSRFRVLFLHGHPAVHVENVRQSGAKITTRARRDEARKFFPYVIGLRGCGSGIGA